MAAADSRWNAERLREACSRSGMSDEQIVARMQELIAAANVRGAELAQIRVYTLQRWQRGENEPRARHALLLARVLGVKLQDILPPVE